jgi:hypothetical protein
MRQFVLLFFAMLLFGCSKEDPPMEPVDPIEEDIEQLTLPLISITDIVPLSFGRARCGGIVMDDGGAEVRARGVCWNTEPNPDINDFFTSNGTGLGGFSSQLTSLRKDSIYYVRAYATNRLGTAYSEELSFEVAGEIFNGSINFTDQTEMDKFGESGYAIITGRLAIFGSDITDLTPLSCLKIIEGELSIDNAINLTNLEGLNRLQTVGGDVKISNNLALTDIDDLEKLSEVGGRLSIFDNLVLSSIQGLGNLELLGGDLTINENDALQSLIGLNRLNSVNTINIVGNDALFSLNGLNQLSSAPILLNINNNESLRNINSLSSLTTVGSLEILRSPLLENIDGLQSLSEVTGKLRIFLNNSITNLDGLAQVTTIGDELMIGSNAQITNLDGLNNLNTLSGALVAVDNAALDDFCGLVPFFSNNDFNHNYTVSSNLFNPTQQDLETGNCSL